MEINTRPVNMKPYRLPHSAKNEIDEQIEKMLEDDIIDITAPVQLLIVPKKSFDDR